MPVGVSLNYLKSMLDDLTKQAEQHYANWQATLGALDLLRHLIEVSQQEDAPSEQAPMVVTIGGME